MIKTNTDISRREILIGCAATMAVAGFPFKLLPVNPSPQASSRCRNKFKESFT